MLPYAALPDASAGEDPDLEEGDPRGVMLRSPAWFTMHSARALVFIQAQSPIIDLICFIGAGMAEASTCTLSVRNGQTVQTGDELGMFHFAAHLTP